MVDITLFELHVHDGLDFSPSSVIGGPDDDVADVESAAEEPAADEEEAGSAAPGRAVGALIGLVVLVGLAAGARKLMSDDLDPIDDLDELDEAIEA